MNLKLTDIRRDDSAQPRAMLNTDHIKDLSDALEDERDLTPVDVFHDGHSYWLADGFHRYSAYHRAKREEIPVNVHTGDLRDAVLYSITVNAKHATLKLTREEKRAGVARLLKDDEWKQWSNREIARRAGVDEKTVRAMRPEVSAENPQIERKVRRGDSEYTMQTAKPKADPPEPITPPANVSEYTQPRYLKTYSPPFLPDPDELEDDLESEEVDDTESADLEPYRPPYPMPPSPDIRVKPDDPSKRRPFMRAFTAAGALSNLSDDVIVAGLLSPENQTPEKDALDLELSVVTEKINRCKAQAELERATLTVQS